MNLFKLLYKIVIGILLLVLVVGCFVSRSYHHWHTMYKDESLTVKKCCICGKEIFKIETNENIKYNQVKVP